MNSAEIKEFALKNGADLVGIAPLSRFEGTAPGNDPRFIAPRAKSIIGLGFRVLRGCLRGNEEGTQFYQFPEMGIVHIDEVHAPTVLRNVTCFLEDNGFEGVALRSVPDRRRGDDNTNNPEHVPTFQIKTARPVAPGRPAPDVLLDFNQAAKICGLVEPSFGGFGLSRRFGPLQRFAFLLTDAELDYDEVLKQTLCDNCGKCVKACPVAALSAKGKLDTWQCTAGRCGADPATNPFMPEGTKAAKGPFDEEAVKKLIPEWYAAYPGVRFGYTPSTCGVACQRECLVHLEKRGVLTDKFKTPFRA